MKLSFNVIKMKEGEKKTLMQKMRGKKTEFGRETDEEIKQIIEKAKLFLY
jgi:hypothetical protein